MNIAIDNFHYTLIILLLVVTFIEKVLDVYNKIDLIIKKIKLSWTSCINVSHLQKYTKCFT